MNDTRFFNLLLSLFLFLPLTGAAAQEWFQSNSFGQPVKPVTALEAAGMEWALKIDRTGNREISRLYQTGSEKRRWERVREGDKLLEEAYFDRGVPREHTFYDPFGRMTEEWVFGPTGQLEEKIRYLYPDDPAVTLWLSREVVSADGIPLGTDNFSYRPDGSLKSIRKTGADGATLYQIFRYSGSGSVKEIASTRGEGQKSVRYDEMGRLSVEEILKNDTTTLRVDFIYGDDGKLLRRREENTETLTLVVTDYNPEGLAVSEAWYRNSFLSETRQWAYDESGRLIRELVTGGGEKRERRLAYKEAETIPDSEEIYSGGVLIRRILHPEPDLTVEERYHSGTLILKTWLRGGIREKEEHYRDGIPIR
jgi:antitoxin component YwqK of YwqJK toxin-antitoxin module